MEIHNERRNVIVGVNESHGSKVTFVDMALMVLIFIEMMATFVLCFVFTPLIVPLGLIAVFATVVAEIFYYFGSRKHSLPPWPIWIFVGVDVYLIYLAVMFFLGRFDLLVNAMHGIFLLIGIIMIVAGIVMKCKTGGCNTLVWAVCVNIETHTRISHGENGLNRTETMEKPVYSFVYNGQSYIVKKDYYEKGPVKPGEKTKLYINPSNPNLFRYDKESSWLTVLFMGVGFVLCWAFVMVVNSLI